MIDQERLRTLYNGLSDEELARMWGTELVDEARSILHAEITSRGLALPAAAVETAGSRPRHGWFDLRNPYLPPGALVADVHAEAAITIRGLVRLFQWLVISTTLLGVLLFVWVYTALPIAQNVLDVRFAQIGGLSIMAATIASIAAEVLWVGAGIGLYFFRWWGRLLFVAAYACSIGATLVGGMVIRFPIETVLITAATLLDGAVLTLAFLPPLSHYFDATLD